MPNIEIGIIEQSFIGGEWQTKIKVKTDAFARMCHILYTGKDKRVFFSDNYFDLSSGSEHEMCISSSHKIDLNDLQAGHFLTEVS